MVRGVLSLGLPLVLKASLSEDLLVGVSCDIATLRPSATWNGSIAGAATASVDAYSIVSVAGELDWYRDQFCSLPYILYAAQFCLNRDE
ncbi:hypothetical protein KC360_g204 [Hortaea werneckii]|nr:hypothetical protein KC344_g208 [Hortaea werneckii]KAI7180545.1 hypothetical protein KC360_g204 [Hortaea werneckii]